MHLPVAIVVAARAVHHVKTWRFQRRRNRIAWRAATTCHAFLTFMLTVPMCQAMLPLNRCLLRGNLVLKFFQALALTCFLRNRMPVEKRVGLKRGRRVARMLLILAQSVAAQVLPC